MVRGGGQWSMGHCFFWDFDGEWWVGYVNIMILGAAEDPVWALCVIVQTIGSHEFKVCNCISNSTPYFNHLIICHLGKLPCFFLLLEEKNLWCFNHKYFFSIFVFCYKLFSTPKEYTSRAKKTLFDRLL